MTDDHGALRNFELPEGHSNILKSAEWRVRTALQTCDKNEGRQREAKQVHSNELVRFTTRTPCCKQLFRNNYLHFWIVRLPPERPQPARQPASQPQPASIPPGLSPAHFSKNKTISFIEL